MCRRCISFLSLAASLLLALLASPRTLLAGEKKPAVQVWKCSDEGSDHVIWKAPIGPQAGSLAVAGDRVIVGTNNPVGDEEAVVLCFSAETGKQLWRVAHRKMPHRVNDVDGIIVSHFWIDKGRVYYVSNRSELVCVDIADGRIVWKLDMVADLGVFPRDVADGGTLKPSAIVVGDVVYCITGNGINFNGDAVMNPDAPSFLAVNKQSGKVIWSSNAPGKNIVYGQWSRPGRATIDGKDQILFPAGDGFLYSFPPTGGPPLWKVRCPDVYPGQPVRQKPTPISAPLLVDGDVAYVCLSGDFGGSPSHPIYAVDLRTHEIRWRYSDKRFDGTYGPMVRFEDKLYAAGYRGIFVALDAASGKPVWKHEFDDAIWGGPLIFGNKVYVYDYSLQVLAARDGTLLATYEINAQPAIGSPATDGKRIFVATHDYLWALKPAE